MKNKYSKGKEIRNRKTQPTNPPHAVTTNTKTFPGKTKHSTFPGGLKPADRQQRRPAVLLAAVSRRRSPQAGSREQRGPGRQQRVGGCRQQLRRHTGEPKPHGSHASDATSKAQVEGMRVPGQHLEEDIHY